MKTRIILSIGLLLAGFSLLAQERSPGQQLLDQGQRELREFCVDFSSHPIDSVRIHLYRAVRTLADEMKRHSGSRALLLLSEADEYRYSTYDEGLECCDVVLDWNKDSFNRNYVMALVRKAGILTSTDPMRALKLIEEVTPYVIEQLSIPDQVDAYYGTATTLYQCGDYAEAFLRLSKLRELDTAQMDDATMVPLIKALTDYAHFLFNWGEIEQAASLVEECIKHLKDRGLLKSTAWLRMCSTMSDMCLFLDDNEEAMDWWIQGWDQASKYLGIDSPTTLNFVFNVSHILSQVNETADAIQLTENYTSEMERICGKESLPVLFLENQLGFLYDKQRRFPEACQALEKVILISEKLHRHTGINYANYGTVLRGNGDLEKAARMASKGIDAFREELHNAFLSLSEKGRESYWWLSAKPVSQLLFYAAHTPADRDGLLFNLALLTKGVLMESSAQLIQAAQKNAEPSFLEAISHYQNLQIRLEDLYAQPSADEETVKATKKDLLAAETDLLALSQERGQELFWFRTTWQDVATCLRKDEAAIEYMKYDYPYNLGTHWVASVLVPGRSPVNVDLEGVDLPALLKASPDSLYATDLLYKTFVRPLEPVLRNAKRVYFSPTTAMSALAIENVPSRYEMVRVSSTRQLAASAASARWNSAVLFGGLDYNLGLEEMEYYAQDSRSRGGDPLHNWSYLRGSLEEVNSIAAMMGSPKVVTISGGEGVEERFKALSGNAPSVLHIATHGYYDSDAVPEGGTKHFTQEDLAMMASGLVFSGANNRVTADSGMDDGLLCANEIARMNLTGCELLVLSACATGKGLANSSEEFYGLMRAFKKAGCRSILMSLWDVDDEATRLFMESFYRSILKGDDNAAAMKKAREAVKRKYPSPRYWAGFILID